MRNLVLFLTAAIVLVIVNYGIWQREELLSSGRTVLLELAPVDPRSLMQGDYMALRFKVADDAFHHGRITGLRDGRIVLAIDSKNIGTFRRFSDSAALKRDEVSIRYRIRNGEPKFATNAFFFQEKQGDLYSRAKYGEFRLSPDGEAILVSLRDEELHILGPERAGTE